MNNLQNDVHSLLTLYHELDSRLKKNDITDANFDSKVVKIAGSVLIKMEKGKDGLPTFHFTVKNWFSNVWGKVCKAFGGKQKEYNFTNNFTKLKERFDSVSEGLQSRTITLDEKQCKELEKLSKILNTISTHVAQRRKEKVECISFEILAPTQALPSPNLVQIQPSVPSQELIQMQKGAEDLLTELQNIPSITNYLLGKEKIASLGSELQTLLRHAPQEAAGKLSPTWKEQAVFLMSKAQDILDQASNVTRYVQTTSDISKQFRSERDTLVKEVELLKHLPWKGDLSWIKIFKTFAKPSNDLEEVAQLQKAIFHNVISYTTELVSSPLISELSQIEFEDLLAQARESLAFACPTTLQELKKLADPTEFAAIATAKKAAFHDVVAKRDSILLVLQAKREEHLCQVNSFNEKVIEPLSAALKDEWQGAALLFEKMVATLAQEKESLQSLSYLAPPPNRSDFLEAWIQDAARKVQARLTAVEKQLQPIAQAARPVDRERAVMNYFHMRQMVIQGVMYGNDLKDIKEALDLGAEVNQVDKNGITPLMKAAFSGNIGIMLQLLKRGADVSLVSKSGHNVLTQLKGARPPDWKLMTELIKTYALPETCNYAKYYTKTKLLAGAFQMKGKTVFDSKTIDLEGFSFLLSAKTIADSIKAFAERSPDSIDIGAAEELSESLKYSADQTALSAGDILDRIRQDKPTFINTGFTDHVVNILIWKDLIVLCDRGGGPIKPLEVYRYDPAKLDQSAIQLMLDAANKSEENYIQMRSETLPAKLGFTKEDNETLLEKAALQPTQIAGNCWWAALEGNVKAYLLLAKIQDSAFQFPRENGPSLTASVDTTFRKWLFFQQVTLLKKQIAQHTDLQLLDGCFKTLLAAQAVLAESGSLEALPELEEVETQVQENLKKPLLEKSQVELITRSIEQAKELRSFRKTTASDLKKLHASQAAAPHIPNPLNAIEINRLRITRR